MNDGSGHDPVNASSTMVQRLFVEEPGTALHVGKQVPADSHPIVFSPASGKYSIDPDVSTSSMTTGRMERMSGGNPCACAADAFTRSKHNTAATTSARLLPTLQRRCEFEEVTSFRRVLKCFARARRLRLRDIAACRTTN